MRAEWLRVRCSPRPHVRVVGQRFDTDDDGDCEEIIVLGMKPKSA